eukprot:1928100-Rhodomonas_salina.2
MRRKPGKVDEIAQKRPQLTERPDAIQQMRSVHSSCGITSGRITLIDQRQNNISAKYIAVLESLKREDRRARTSRKRCSNTPATTCPHPLRVSFCLQHAHVRAKRTLVPGIGGWWRLRCRLQPGCGSSTAGFSSVTSRPSRGAHGEIGEDGYGEIGADGYGEVGADG